MGISCKSFLSWSSVCAKIRGDQITDIQTNTINKLFLHVAWGEREDDAETKAGREQNWFVA
jgi:hypothetical protein